MPQHGTLRRYQLGCPCKKCRVANNVAHLDYMNRHPEQREKARRRSALARGSEPNSRRPAVRHGTLPGVRRHQRRDEFLCDECVKFYAARETMAEARRREHLKPCGTGAALRRHYRNGEEIDDLCREAFNERERIRRSGSGRTNSTR